MKCKNRKCTSKGEEKIANYYSGYCDSCEYALENKWDNEKDDRRMGENNER